MFTAALPFLGGAVGGLMDYFSARSANSANRDIARNANAQNMQISRENNAFSAQQAQRQMDYQERMSSSAWQRGVADMKRAGINPMLAVSQGGASSPGGAMASPTSLSANVGAPMQPNLRGTAVNALSAFRLVQDLKNAASQQNLTDHLAVKTQADTMVSSAKAALAMSHIPGANIERDIDLSSYGKAIRYINRSIPAASSAGSLIRGLIPGIRDFKNLFKK